MILCRDQKKDRNLSMENWLEYQLTQIYGTRMELRLGRQDYPGDLKHLLRDQKSLGLWMDTSGPYSKTSDTKEGTTVH